MQTSLQHLDQQTIDAYLLGTLGDGPREAVESHFLSCQECEQRAAAAWPFDQLIETLTLSGCERGSPPTPLQLDRYRLVRRLGEGGMGTVWLAEHLVLRSFVALKIVRPDRLAQEGAAQRFLREMQTVARLRHPNIVAGLDAELTGDRYVLAMEYVDGPTLAERIARERVPPIEACRAVREAALGLAHAHGAGFIHRDIKPSNLIQSATGEVKILDFGIVSAAAGEGSITAQNCVMGTPDYIAPEQAEDARAADARSDIYSLGCTFYHLLSGRVPFPDESILKKLDGHRLKQPPPLRDIGPRLQAIVAKMLAKRPADRFQSALEVATALEPYCSGRLPVSAAIPRGRGIAMGLVAAACLAAVGIAGVAVYSTQTDRGDPIHSSKTEFAAAPTKLTPGAIAAIGNPKIFAGHKKRIRRVAFSPDDKTIYSGGDDGEAIAWDRETGAIRHRFPHSTPDSRLVSISFADEGKTLITATFDSLFAWDTETGQRRKWFDDFALEPDLCYASASPNGRRVALSHESGRVRVLELPTGKLAFDFPAVHGVHAYKVVWLRDDTRIAYGLANGKVVVQNIANGSAAAFQKNPFGVVDLAVSPDGKTVSYANWHGDIISFDATSNVPAGFIETFNPDENQRTARLAYAPNGWLVTAGRHVGALWDAKRSSQLAEFMGGNSQVTTVAISSDGRWLVGGGESEDPTVRLWRMPEE